MSDCARGGEAAHRRAAPANTFEQFPREDLDKSIVERFEAQVTRYPEKRAVRTKTADLTYRALNVEANRVAQVLLDRRGESPEQIAILMENDASMIAAILGVLKTGKAYVPLDPLLPRERTDFMLENSESVLLVTNNRNLSLARELAGEKVGLVNVDEPDPRPPAENPGLSVSPETTAWILYTSGSTGKPKGVVQIHKNVLHYVMNYTNGLHVSADDRLTLLFSFNVNAAAHDIFTALLTGASLYPFNVKEDGVAGLADWLTSNKVTVYCSVPTLFRHFTDSLTNRESLPDLRLIKMVGEPVYRRHLEAYRRHFPDDCIFIDRLGSTETGSIRWYFIDKKTQVATERVPVGYPVEDNEILLLDGDRREVPTGEIGEIAVRSRYLSPGYWRRPDLNEKVFLSDPGGTDKRIYLTGDLGRMGKDGNLEHLGRKDFQVKIRGHRIEVAEVEACLLRHEGIKEAVVMAREAAGGDQRLVAYLIPEEGGGPTVSALRRHLAGHLPDYMIPSAFVILDELPLAPNGKVYLKGLPEPGRARPNLDSRFVEPRTPVERELAAIWLEVLDVDGIGVEDNFLELGGDSLLAGRVISRVLKRFRVKVPLKALFVSPTVAEMAVVIAGRLAERAEPGDIDRLLSQLEERSGKEV